MAKGSIFKSIFCVIVTIAVLAGVGFAGYAIGMRYDRAEDESATGGTEEGCVIGDVVENGITLMSSALSPEQYDAYGVSALADSAYTLTATITPADSIDLGVNLSVDWQDKTDEWASDKNVDDYVILSAYEIVSGQSITVTCLKDFSEQIEITATASGNKSLKAICVLEYQQQLIDIEYNLNDGEGYYIDNGYEINNTTYGTVQNAGKTLQLMNYDTGSSDWDKELTITIYGKPVFSEGTIEYEEKSYSGEATIKTLDDFTIPSIYEIYENNNYDITVNATTRVYYAQEDDNFYVWKAVTQITVTYNMLYCSLFCGTDVMGDELTVYQKNELYSLLSAYENENGSSAAFFAIDFTDPTNGSHTFYYDCYYSPLATTATNISLDKNTIIFTDTKA